MCAGTRIVVWVGLCSGIGMGVCMVLCIGIIILGIIIIIRTHNINGASVVILTISVYVCL